MSPTVQCAYIGLGAMGNAMAGHIAQKLSSLGCPPLLAFNRTQARAEALAQTHPVTVASSLDQVATANIIFSCLLNDAAVIETLDTLIPLLKTDTILVEQSTISPALAQKYAAKAKEAGVVYLACPVMGPPIKAKSGDLTVLMAGGESAEIRGKVLPLLIPVVGKKVIELGLQDVAESLRLKLCGNYFVTSVVEMVAEGMTLGEASGVGQDKVKELLDAVFPNSLMGVYADRMLKNTYKDEIAFPITTAKKDVAHIVQLAKDSGAKLPITEAFLKNADEVLENHGNYDLSSVVGNLRVQAGLHFDLAEKK